MSTNVEEQLPAVWQQNMMLFTKKVLEKISSFDGHLQLIILKNGSNSIELQGDHVCSFILVTLYWLNITTVTSVSKIPVNPVNVNFGVIISPIKLPSPLNSDCLLKCNIKYTYTVYNKNILKITEIVLNISDIYMMEYILVANVKEDNLQCEKINNTILLLEYSHATHIFPQDTTYIVSFFICASHCKQKQSSI